MLDSLIIVISDTTKLGFLARGHFYGQRTFIELLIIIALVFWIDTMDC